MNETIIDTTHSYFDRQQISAYLGAYTSHFYSLFSEHIKEALDHLILVILAYLVICISTYQLIFRRYINRFNNLFSSVRLAQYRRVLIVTAHPDDECMFFGPTILSLTQREEPCTVYLLCLSNGNFDQKGNVRKHELYDAIRVLHIREENVTLMNSTLLADDPNVNWKTELVAKQIQNEIESLDIEALITFDRDGVSYHPNHCAIYYAAASLCLAGYLPKNCKIITLDSVNVVRKYLSVFDLVISLLLSSNWCVLSWTHVNIVRKAMRQHRSQMLWFRKLYIIFSRYMMINTLRELNVSDIELDMQINDT